MYIVKKKFDRISWALVDAVAMPTAPCGYECLSAAEEGRTGDDGNARGVSRPNTTYRVWVELSMSGDFKNDALSR